MLSSFLEKINLIHHIVLLLLPTAHDTFFAPCPTSGSQERSCHGLMAQWAYKQACEPSEYRKRF